MSQTFISANNISASIISTDEGPSLLIESSAIINLRGVSTKLIKYIVFTMHTYKKLKYVTNCNCHYIVSTRCKFLRVYSIVRIEVLSYFSINIQVSTGDYVKNDNFWLV